MFRPPVYVRSSFALNFAQQVDIRRRANDFEDILRGKGYIQPQIIPVPDNLDPEIPRMIFASQDTFSHIVISQINATLNLRHPPECRKNIAKCKRYLLDRSPIPFELLRVLEEVKPYFCGLISVVRLPSLVEDDEILKRMAELSLGGDYTPDVHDIVLKTTRIVSDRFFSNVTWKNFRAWRNIEPAPSRFRPLSTRAASERGIEILIDFNDRYKFNESTDYYSGPDVVKELIEHAFDQISAAVEKVKEI